MAMLVPESTEIWQLNAVTGSRFNRINHKHSTCLQSVILYSLDEKFAPSFRLHQCRVSLKKKIQVTFCFLQQIFASLWRKMFSLPWKCMTSWKLDCSVTEGCKAQPVSVSTLECTGNYCAWVSFFFPFVLCLF